MPDAQIRRDLFATQLDPDRAERVMDLFAPAGASELVTRDYFHRELAELRERTVREIAEQGREHNRAFRQMSLANVAMWVTTIAAIVVT